MELDLDHPLSLPHCISACALRHYILLRLHQPDSQHPNSISTFPAPDLLVIGLILDKGRIVGYLGVNEFEKAALPTQDLYSTQILGM